MLDMAESLGHSKLLRSIGHNKTKTFQEHMLAQCWTSIANAGPVLYQNSLTFGRSTLASVKISLYVMWNKWLDLYAYLQVTVDHLITRCKPG